MKDVELKVARMQDGWSDVCNVIGGTVAEVKVRHHMNLCMVSLISSQ